MHLKIVLTIPLPQFERGLSRLLFSYYLHGILFPTYSNIANDLLKDFHFFFLFTKNRFSQNSKVQLLTLFQLSHYRGSKEYSLNYHLHTVCMVYYFLYISKWPLIFYKIFKTKKIFILKDKFINTISRKYMLLQSSRQCAGLVEIKLRFKHQVRH